MSWKKVLCLTVAAVLVITAGYYLQGAWDYHQEYKNARQILLDDPVVYDDGLHEQIEQMREEKLECVLWRERRNQLVENKEYARCTRVDSIGFAGNSSYLFPNANVLELDDTQYCLLGKNTSEELFGTTQTVGRTVTVAGREYQVAGIIFSKKDLFAYELDSAKGEEVTELMYRYKDRVDGQLADQKIRNVYGLCGEENKDGKCSIRAYFKGIRDGRERREGLQP